MRGWVVLLVCVGMVGSIDPDQDRTGPELITSKGYPLERHWVETSDHYVLGMLRIPHGRSGKGETPGKPVLLQHGLLDSSDTWIENFATQSLAFLLADDGYDVWLGNNRGNKYSSNNTKLSPWKRKFWQFTWDEMATIDLPDMVNYVLNVTNQPKLGLVGHSEGTTQVWANLCTKESVADKVAVFLGLAPVAYVYHTKSLLLKGLSELDMDKIVALIDDMDFLPTSKLLRELLPAICNSDPGLCDDVAYMIAGFSNKTDINQTRWGVYTAHFPSGTSTKNIIHWAQAVRKDRFERYNYGLAGNLEHYGQSTPPPYKLKDIHHHPPTAVFWGGHDDLADTKDVKHLLEDLPNGTIVGDHSYPNWGHIDFVWGVDATIACYGPARALLKQYLA